MLKRNFFNLIAFLFITFLWRTSLGGTILINPTGDGGFETGTTFDTNGWTIVGTSDNHYFVGTAPGQYAGERCAFISNEASSWVGTLSSIFRHMYRNVLFPDNETEITLTFLYKINTVETTGIDHFRIYLIDTTTTPQVNGYPQGDLIYKSNLSGITANTWETLSISIPANYAGFRKRLVISWYNNNAHPNTVIAFDNIELTSKVPDIISNLPYTTDMTPVKNIVSMPSGWMNLKSSATYPWIITTNNNIGYHSSPYIAIINKSSAAAKNEWLISPPVSVVNGNAYIIKFWVKAPGSGSNPEKLKVHWGTTPTVQALTANTAIYDNPNMFITDWTEVSINFTATTTRNIYFGWHGYSASNVDYIALDDISILPATPIMTISESAYDFGLAYIGEGTCTPHTFTATNSGAGTIIISNSPIITIAAEDFNEVNNYTVTINFILEAENPLPVELSSFSAIATAQNYVMIEWTTQSETNVSGFYLFRNTENDPSAAERINAFIAATNTSHETDYVLYDREVLSGHTYYYWLQNIDLNGEFDFHGPVSVTISSGANNIPDIPINTGLQVVYPNPFIDQATIAFGLTKDEEVKVMIFNTKGELIRNLYSGSKKAGNYRVFWDGCNDRGKTAPSGIYFVRMKAGKNNSSLMLTLIK
ncbi:MAG TPA: choice-of-anchor J domain-containing protein [Candidatus Cloacimonadota bacterium]|nr:choice-of-anchor J domain-containing protein [Candidatus Cloacimonadota bacterium]HQL14905.1 choice-of-anchor J domain-containing protein [Candidatus Cloacimonadota bacterium]